MPHALVFAVRENAPAVVVTWGVTDLSGRFLLKTQEVGVFRLCVEVQGLRRNCLDTVFRDPLPRTSLGTQRLPLPAPSAGSSVAAVWGAVSLQDGGLVRGFAPMMGVNVYPAVEIESRSGLKRRVEVNEFGQYVMPGVPVGEDFVLRAQVENEKLERPVLAQTGLAPGRAYQIDMLLRNSPPRIRVVSATANGKPVQVAEPGSTVDLHAVADDPDGDALQYRWLLPDGTIVGPTADPVLHFAVPAQRATHIVAALVSDRRGGFAQSGIRIRADNQVASFGGNVTDTGGSPIDGAVVSVNGRNTATDLGGRFRLGVPIADRYVMTIRSPGTTSPSQPAFGTHSYIYKAPVEGGAWRLRRAHVATVDPTQPITLRHQRDERDCARPRASVASWDGLLSPDIFQWQDGRGNALGLADLGARDPEAIRGVMRLAGRLNPRLVEPFARATGVGPQQGDERGACLPGIGIEIPANSLVDLSTNQPPSGPVQVPLSTVALTTGDQMPGDYSALDASGKLTAMESFGAGAVEIGAGGQRFNLKPGAEATVTIPIDATQRAGRSSFEPTVPFLYYDEREGVWKQDGVATLTSGPDPAYVRKVSHFSTMNADILKTGQSCVAVELDPKAGFTLPLSVEVTMQPSKPNPEVIQVRTLTVDSMRSNVIYNLPNNSDIVLTPLVAGKLPDGTDADVPAGVFVVNTGGPMNAAVVPPPANPDGAYYAESGGHPTGPCAARVTLSKLGPVALAAGYEFLQGLSFQASNITEHATDATIVNAIDAGVGEYYKQADPRGLRDSLNHFKSKNRFGQPATAGEIETFAHYANSGDLGFGRDMHCRRNVASDSTPTTPKFDYACYVTNFGQPPANNPDQQDANDVVDPTKHPDATVAMEFSRVENPPGPIEFPDEDRAVKFYAYLTKNPDSAPLHSADLDGKGDRPIPQLCMVCHGGRAASEGADPTNPGGVQKGSFALRSDVVNMHSNFLPFDLHFFNFPTSEPKSSAAVQARFKSLNTDVVREVSKANGTFGNAIVELIDAWYAGGSATQLEDAVIAGWDPANSSSNKHRFYRDVFARACRTCHVAQPFTAPPFTSADDFESSISQVQSRVCNQHVMPHAQRTNDVFWTSRNPNMAAFLELYGQTLTGWLTDPVNQCSQGPVQGGTTLATTVFTGKVLPILTDNCGGCHSTTGNANFAVGGSPTAVYNQLLTAVAKDGSSHYIAAHDATASLLFHRISTGGASEPGARMPLGGPDLTTTDTGTPPNGAPDATVISTWIAAGATPP